MMLICPVGRSVEEGEQNGRVSVQRYRELSGLSGGGEEERVGECRTGENNIFVKSSQNRNTIHNRKVPRWALPMAVYQYQTICAPIGQGG